MRILVAVASRYGSAREIALAIARTLRATGHAVDVQDAAAVGDLAPYEAIVLGSAIYNQAWLTEFAALLRRHAEALAARPVWLFSVGSLSSERGWPWGALARREPRGIGVVLAAIRPRDYHVFAGAVAPQRVGRVGRLAYTLLYGRCGDERDWREVATWAERIARELPVPAAVPPR